jgi:hypothetical protein
VLYRLATMSYFYVLSKGVILLDPCTAAIL